MKVSKEKQKEIRRDLIRAAVELFKQKGLSSATMKEISTKAGYGAATIYNYFPSKDKIFFAYFEEKQSELRDTLDEISEFDTFTLKEKLQIQMESLLDGYLKDRDFVGDAYKMILDSPMKTYSEIATSKKEFTQTVHGFLASAIEKEEIPPQPFENFLVNLYWDYGSLIVFYWLKDESPGYTNTSQLIDLTLDVVVDVIKSGIVTKTADILSFLFRSHLYSNIDKVQGLFSLIGKFQNTLKQPRE